MRNRVDLSFRHSVVRNLSEFAVGAGTAALAISSVILLLVKSAQHDVSSTVFRYVGF
jgi:hypothetical protein